MLNQLTVHRAAILILAVAFATILAVVAGGLESISLVQMNMNTKYLRSDWIMQHKPALYMPMIETADIVAKRYDVSREYQDEYSDRKSVV